MRPNTTSKTWTLFKSEKDRFKRLTREPDDSLSSDTIMKVAKWYPNLVSAFIDYGKELREVGE